MKLKFKLFNREYTFEYIKDKEKHEKEIKFQNRAANMFNSRAYSNYKKALMNEDYKNHYYVLEDCNNCIYYSKIILDEGKIFFCYEDNLRKYKEIQIYNPELLKYSKEIWQKGYKIKKLDNFCNYEVIEKYDNCYSSLLEFLVIPVEDRTEYRLSEEYFVELELLKFNRLERKGI